WQRIASLVRQAYEKVAPRSLAVSIGETLRIKSPPAKLAPHEIDPLKSPRAKEIRPRFSKLCLALPEVSEDVQFGWPVWKGGKKLLPGLHAAGSAPMLLFFWVGVPAQGFMTAAPCSHIPAYMGHNGWIALDVTDHCDWEEVRGLTTASYRHFA